MEMTLYIFQSGRTTFHAIDELKNFVMIGALIPALENKSLLSKPKTALLLVSPNAYR